MKKIWAKFFDNKCEHQTTLTTWSVGVERTVCEECGHLSFSIAPNLVLTDELTTQHEEEVELQRAAGL